MSNVRGGAGVRLAGPADLDALTALFEGYLEFYKVDADSAAARRYLAGHLAAGTAHVLIAELADGSAAEPAVGFAQLYPTYDSLALGRRLVLYDLFVAPQARGRGVGRALLDAAVELGRSLEVVSLTLDTAHDNTTAQALYESAGFVRDTEFRTYELALD